MEMTLQDGTKVRAGDKVRAKGEDGRLRVCKVLEILRGCGVDKALLTAPIPFGTVIRSRYQIKPRARGMSVTRGRGDAVNLVSDCHNAPIRNSGITLWNPSATPGMWCSGCGIPCNGVFPPYPNQEEWDQAYEESRAVLEKFIQYSMGVKLCPAHARKIIQLCEDAEIKDWPKNPGRKDG